MAVVKTEAIVLSTSKWRESSLILRALSKELGKISVVAKGVRRPKSRIGAGLEQFSRLNLTLYIKKDSDIGTLKESEIIDNHFYLREDLTKFAFASTFLEIIERTLQPRNIIDSLFELTATFLDELKQTSQPTLLGILFLLRLVSKFGFEPNLEECAKCGERSNLTYFCAIEGGTVCARCAAEKEKIYLVPFDTSTRDFLLKSFSIPLSNIKDLKIDKSSALPIYQAAKDLITYQLEIKLKSLRFLEETAF